MMAQTVHTAPVKGLERYTFERTQLVTFDGVLTLHHWLNNETGDYATRFSTKASCVANARRFERGLKAEGYYDRIEGSTSVEGSTSR